MRNTAKHKFKGITNMITLQNSVTQSKKDDFCVDEQQFVVRKDSNGNVLKQPKILNDSSDLDKDKYVAKPSNPNINFQFKKKKLKRTSTTEIPSAVSSKYSGSV